MKKATTKPEELKKLRKQLENIIWIDDEEPEEENDIDYRVADDELPELVKRLFVRQNGSMHTSETTEIYYYPESDSYTSIHSARELLDCDWEEGYPVLTYDHIKKGRSWKAEGYCFSGLELLNDTNNVFWQIDQSGESFALLEEVMCRMAPSTFVKLRWVASIYSKDNADILAELQDLCVERDPHFMLIRDFSCKNPCKDWLDLNAFLKKWGVSNYALYMPIPEDSDELAMLYATAIELDADIKQSSEQYLMITRVTPLCRMPKITD